MTIKTRIAKAEKAKRKPEENEYRLYWPGDEPPGEKIDIILHWPEDVNHDTQEPAS
jgi:hypothetical protein